MGVPGTASWLSNANQHSSPPALAPLWHSVRITWAQLSTENKSVTLKTLTTEACADQQRIAHEVCFMTKDLKKPSSSDLTATKGSLTHTLRSFIRYSLLCEGPQAEHYPKIIDTQHPSLRSKQSRYRRRKLYLMVRKLQFPLTARSRALKAGKYCLRFSAIQYPCEKFGGYVPR